MTRTELTSKWNRWKTRSERICSPQPIEGLIFVLERPTHTRQMKACYNLLENTIDDRRCYKDQNESLEG